MWGPQALARAALSNPRWPLVGRVVWQTPLPCLYQVIFAQFTRIGACNLPSAMSPYIGERLPVGMLRMPTHVILGPALPATRWLLIGARSGVASGRGNAVGPPRRSGGFAFFGR